MDLGWENWGDSDQVVSVPRERDSLSSFSNLGGSYSGGISMTKGQARSISAELYKWNALAFVPSGHDAESRLFVLGLKLEHAHGVIRHM